MVFYGSQKLFGVMGGGGLQGTVAGFSSMGFPAFMTYLAIAAEFLGGLGLLAGLLTRVAAAGIAVTMAVATWVNVAQTTTLATTFVDGVRTDPLKEIAYPGLIMVMALALVLVGAGKLSLDHYVLAKRKNGTAT